MQIDLSNLNISFDKKKKEIKELDIVEHGLFQGTQSDIEFILNNSVEVIKRFHKICEHMNKYDSDVALNKSIFASKTIDAAEAKDEEKRTPLESKMIKNKNAMDEMLSLIESVKEEENELKRKRLEKDKSEDEIKQGKYMMKSAVRDRKGLEDIQGYIEEWKDTIDIPDDKLTKIMLRCITLNKATKFIFDRFRNGHNSVVGFGGGIIATITKRAYNKYKWIEEWIDEL